MKSLLILTFTLLTSFPTFAKSIEKDGFKLEIPDKMRIMDFVTDETRRFYANGDGLILPPFDENESPVQVGVSVEKFDKIDQKFSEWIDLVSNSYKHDPRLNLMQKGTIILSNDVKLLKAKSYSILQKGDDRKSVHTKHFYLLPSGKGYILSTWIVASKTSKKIDPDGEWYKVLTKIQESFKLQ